LGRLGDIGRVAALSTHQNVILDARPMGRTAIRFCIHALFRDICLDKAHPLINPKQPLAKAAFFGFLSERISSPLRAMAWQVRPP
jgi:hypothetical protein